MHNMNSKIIKSGIMDKKRPFIKGAKRGAQESLEGGKQRGK